MPETAARALAQGDRRAGMDLLFIFTFELLSKVLAYGFFFHREAYLRDPWCQLDFVVVSLAWLPILFPQMGNYSVLRAFRALRPLRAQRIFPIRCRDLLDQVANHFDSLHKKIVPFRLVHPIGYASPGAL